MNPYLIWNIAYLIPIIVVLALIYVLKNGGTGTALRTVIIHSGLLVSTIISSYLLVKEDISLPFLNISIFFFAFIGSALFAILLLGKFGFAYTLSSFLQELCILSLALILLNSLSWYTVILLLVPIYSLSHVIHPEKWKTKVLVTFLWGAGSLILFVIVKDVYLNITLHNFFGAILIFNSVIYSKSNYKIKRRKN